MTRHRAAAALGAAIALASAGAASRAETRLPPGRTGGDGSNQAAGPSGQHPGQVGEIGGAGPHPGPLSAKGTTKPREGAAGHDPARR